MARPTASVWASNQVARRDAQLVRKLAEVTAHLQGGVQPDRDRYAAAIGQHRELLNQLRERIEQVLADAGLRAAPPVIAAAVQNFRAGLTDDVARPLLERGRLEHDVGLDAGGVLFGMAAVDPSPEPAAPPAPRPPPPGLAAAVDQHRERERREQARAQAKVRAEAERRVHTLRKSAEAATSVRVRRESEAQHARGQLEIAESALASSQAAEREAAAALAEAQDALEKLPGKSA